MLSRIPGTEKSPCPISCSVRPRLRAPIRTSRKSLALRHTTIDRAAARRSRRGFDSCRRFTRHGRAGHESTLPVTIDEMLHHTRAVRRGTRRALLVADMPYGSYHTDMAESLHNAMRLRKGSWRGGREGGGRGTPSRVDFAADGSGDPGDGARRLDAAIGDALADIACKEKHRMPPSN